MKPQLLALLLSVPLDDPTPGLIDRLGDSDPDVREAASAELRKLGAKAIPALEEAAEDSDAEVRMRAREILVSKADELVEHQILSGGDPHVKVEQLDPPSPFKGGGVEGGSAQRQVGMTSLEGQTNPTVDRKAPLLVGGGGKARGAEAIEEIGDIRLSRSGTGRREGVGKAAPRRVRESPG